MQVENGSVEALGSRIVENVGRVLVGKAAEIELCVIALLGRGHILIEDVPGVGKTMLAKSLARSLGCSFERLQFTPDLLPSDVTGVNIYSPSTQQFEFRQGPIFTQVLLADEINRATPKTQSALLEAMEEKQVTVDGTTYPLPLPFMVLATQNPVEFAGTFPLPEAQVDRFLMRVNLGYLDVAHEVQVLDRFQRGSPTVSSSKPTPNCVASRRRKSWPRSSKRNRYHRRAWCRVSVVGWRASRASACACRVFPWLRRWRSSSFSRTSRGSGSPTACCTPWSSFLSSVTSGAGWLPKTSWWNGRVPRGSTR